MKLLETEWLKFREAVIPKDAGSTQLTDMRRAFFGGAWAIYSLMMLQMDSDREPNDEDLGLMRALDAEMRQFVERVKKGWA